MASKYGAIRYYEDTDIEKWCPELAITKILGMRTFWDMQQNQEIHILRIIDWMPYIIELDFEGDKLVGKQEHCHVEKEFKGKQRADKK